MTPPGAQGPGDPPATRVGLLPATGAAFRGHFARSAREKRRHRSAAPKRVAGRPRISRARGPAPTPATTAVRRVHRSGLGDEPTGAPRRHALHRPTSRGRRGDHSGRRIRAPAFDSANVVSPEWTRASSTCPSCHHPGMVSASESTEAPPFVRAAGAACTRSRIPRRLPSRRDRGRDREAPAPLRGLAAEVDTKPCPFVVILWFTEANLHITPARCPSVPKHGRHAPRRSSRGPRRDESSRGRPQAATAPERSIPGR